MLPPKVALIFFISKPTDVKSKNKVSSIFKYGKVIFTYVSLATLKQSNSLRLLNDGILLWNLFIIIFRCHFYFLEAKGGEQ